MSEEIKKSEGYQIMVVNIVYGKELNSERKMKERPTMTILDVPMGIVAIKDKNEDKFLETIETFAYDTVTKKYRAECRHCQVYLPLD